jgi:hypothetical protein
LAEKGYDSFLKSALPLSHVTVASLDEGDYAARELKNCDHVAFLSMRSENRTMADHKKRPT